MTEIIHLLMILAFVSVWIMIGSDLVGRHAREMRNAHGNGAPTRTRRNR